MIPVVHPRVRVRVDLTHDPEPQAASNDPHCLHSFTSTAHLPTQCLACLPNDPHYLHSFTSTVRSPTQCSACLLCGTGSKGVAPALGGLHVKPCPILNEHAASPDARPSTGLPPRPDPAVLLLPPTCATICKHEWWGGTGLLRRQPYISSFRCWDCAHE